MATKIRLTRIGRRHRPFYRVVVTDVRAPRNGRFIETLGFYNPLPVQAEVQIKRDRALYWLQTGAIPTNTVQNLFQKQGIYLELDLTQRGLSPDQIAVELQKHQLVQDERRKRLAEKRAKKKSKKAIEAASKEVTTQSTDVEVPAAAEAVSDEPAKEEPPTQ